MRAENQSTVEPCLIERSGRAMGSTAQVIVTGDRSTAEPIAAWAMNRIEELEERWSRFLSTSEVSAMNDSPGSAVAVSADTITLVERAIEARDMSGGRFDPTLLQAIQANGYDRTFVSIKTPPGMPALDVRRIGLGTISANRAAGTVTVGAGCGFDPGGIGKGLAADLVAEEMIARGARGALVNLGGDLRCIGEGPASGTWVVAIGDVVAGVENQILELAEGAVASSTPQRRRWQNLTSDGVVDAHHLIDPTTGRSAERAANLVTVVAQRCADAEWLATAIAAEGALPQNPDMIGNAAVFLTNHLGDTFVHGAPEQFLR